MKDLNQTRTRWVWRILGVAAVVVLVVGACCLYCGISSSLQAENNLHATIFVVRLVDQFVSTEGRWPRSWDELKRLSPVEANGFPGDGSWPAASTEIQQRVEIDFDADPAAILAQDPMEFVAIKPIGPYYEYRDYGYVASLHATLKKAPLGAGSGPR